MAKGNNVACSLGEYHIVLARAKVRTAVNARASPMTTNDTPIASCSDPAGRKRKGNAICGASPALEASRRTWGSHHNLSFVCCCPFHLWLPSSNSFRPCSVIASKCHNNWIRESADGGLDFGAWRDTRACSLGAGFRGGLLYATTLTQNLQVLQAPLNGLFVHPLEQ